MDNIKVTLIAKNEVAIKGELNNYQEKINQIHQLIHEKNGPVNQFLGWLNLPNEISKEEIEKIKHTAQKIQNQSDAVVVIGVGGSYLGSKSLIEALKPSFYNQLPKKMRVGPEVYFAGQNMSESYLLDIIKVLDQKDVSLIVISKSGTTLEPAIAFKVLREFIEKKYGQEEAINRIFVITDKQQGVLRQHADQKGYENFIIPDDIGGRYSVLSAVGLLPIAVSGIDIDQLLSGAKDGIREFSIIGLEKNPAYYYATLRNILNKEGKEIEILANFEPRLHSFSDWWKQLFGESEGKENKGIFPASVDFTTDLHSLGQYIQEGRRILFETFLNFEKPTNGIVIKEGKNDGLDYLDGKSIDLINKSAFSATLKAHNDGDVAIIAINIPELNTYYLGKLIYFFEKACAVSAYLSGVNPFDQPGVDQYKKNMYSILKNDQG